MAVELQDIEAAVADVENQSNASIDKDKLSITDISTAAGSIANSYSPPCSEQADATTLPSDKMVWAANAGLLLLAWAALFFVMMPKCFIAGEADCVHPGLPGGAMFDILLVVVAGFMGGQLVHKTTGLPPLLGMLIVGCVLRNILMQLTGIPASTNAMLRNIALAMIMLRAGMGLNLERLRKNAVSTVLLSFVPCLCEATTIAFISRLFFPFLSLPFAFMLGFCIADVSPAVTTPILLDFMDKGLGVNKGIPDVLLTAGSVNSVVAIVMYSIAWEFAWTDSVSASKLAEVVGVKLVAQIVGIGVMAGYVLGRLTEVAISRWLSTANERFYLTLSVSLLTLFGFKTIGMGGGGTLAVVTLGATLQNTIADKHLVKPVSDIMATLWTKVGSVLLFTLLGASVDMSKLSGSVLFMAAAIIVVGLIGRSISVAATTSLMGDWNIKERAFALVAQCPKATVQAALATVALDHVTSMIESGVFAADSPATAQMLETANVILTTAVLSIMMTAPAFAVLMVVAGKKWLHLSTPDEASICKVSTPDGASICKV